jgi:hypothetical protein
MGAYKLLYMKSSSQLKISNKVLPFEFSNSHLFSYKTYVGFGVGDTNASYKVYYGGSMKASTPSISLLAYIVGHHDHLPSNTAWLCKVVVPNAFL